MKNEMRESHQVTQQPYLTEGQGPPGLTDR